jgi:hypothetical protein
MKRRRSGLFQHRPESVFNAFSEYQEAITDRFSGYRASIWSLPFTGDGQNVSFIDCPLCFHVLNINNPLPVVHRASAA